MRISLVGGGKVGVTLLYYLKGHHKILGVYDPDKKAQRRAERFLGIKKPVPYPEFVEKSDAVFVATPDDIIQDASNRIRKYLGNNALLVHFSGWLPAEILPRARGALRAAVHPFATFPKLVIPPPRLVYPLFVQGDRKAMDRIRRIFRGKNFTVFRIRKTQKERYHLMGVMSSNLFVSLVAAAIKLTPRGTDREKLFRFAVLPLIEETLDNLKKSGIRDALSGPVKRGDIETIRGHLKILQKNKNRSAIYKSLSANLIRFAPPDKKQRLRELLK